VNDACQFCRHFESPGPDACGGKNALVDGTIIDRRFEIREVLGVGGMSTVYRAVQHSVQRDVALKVLRCSLVGDQLGVERFMREVVAASRLRSPHTVTVLDVGQSREKLLYIAMELLQGRTLEKVLHEAGGVMPLVRAAKIIEQVLISLEEAHGQGILHRDIKPENIFVMDRIGSRDFVKVLDFGVARVMEMPETSATISGLAVGTPVYMSLEQMDCEGQDPRSDLYSLAIVFYELLAGVVPFDADTPTQIAFKKVDGTFLDINVVNPRAEVPRSIEELIRSALSPDADRRPPDAKTFRDGLLAALSQVRPAQQGQSASFLPPMVVPAHRHSAQHRATTPLQQMPIEPLKVNVPPARFSLPRGAISSTSMPAPDVVRQTPRPTPVARPATPPQVPPGQDGTAAATPRPVRQPVQQPPPVPHSQPRRSASSAHRKTHGSTDRRRSDRRRALITARLRSRFGEIAVTVMDLSPTGAFLHAGGAEMLETGELVELRLPSRRTDAEVVMAAEVARNVDQPVVRGEVRGFGVRWMAVRQPVGVTLFTEALAEVRGLTSAPAVSKGPPRR